MATSVSAVSEALLAACRRGEEAAQFQLYQLLSHQLMGVCLRYCPSRAEAEDALQNTFVKLFTRLDQYRAEGPFEAWARRVAVRTSLHALAQHRLRYPGGHGPSDLDDLPPDLPSPEPSALDELAVADLLQHLAALPPGYRAVLNLYAIEGYSHPEIAQLLGIAEGTSKSQLARARQLLAQRLCVAKPKLCQS
ncbi:sigma-70 family RNA polymerase sigma factor [Hymenobacter ginsengisoli]|uniref:Sigma-70 family RNA polymerase sigma factor n=1 Tax=Hymenobacter ginsengisoli TaxID=1051626 RepID=A0ABP8QJQ3_9BACT|nr:MULTISPECIES: sigma-70 family RNA polymerase sigma factor [unclassified Hymenobacter]MBO2029856.1 sigma-70 family RNA polymerase sigma factor [Hymenobacter sp. BT559]